MIPLILALIAPVIILWVMFKLSNTPFKLTLNTQGLFKQASIWLSITLPISFFLALNYIYWDGYELDLSRNGFYNYFENTPRILFYLLGLSIALAALIARAHASEQTAEQTSELQAKNRIDQYYDHRKHFIEEMKEHQGIMTQDFGILSFEVTPQRYRALFKEKPSEGAPRLHEKFRKEKLTLIIDTYWAMHILIGTPELSNNDIDQKLYNFSSKLMELDKALGTEIIPTGQVKFYQQKDKTQRNFHHLIPMISASSNDTYQVYLFFLLYIDRVFLAMGYDISKFNDHPHSDHFLTDRGYLQYFGSDLCKFKERMDYISKNYECYYSFSPPVASPPSP